MSEMENKVEEVTEVASQPVETLEKAEILGYFLGIWRLKYRLYLLLSKLIQSTLQT